MKPPRSSNIHQPPDTTNLSAQICLLIFNQAILCLFFSSLPLLAKSRTRDTQAICPCFSWRLHKQTNNDANKHVCGLFKAIISKQSLDKPTRRRSADYGLSQSWLAQHVAKKSQASNRSTSLSCTCSFFFSAFILERSQRSSTAGTVGGLQLLPCTKSLCRCMIFIALKHDNCMGLIASEVFADQIFLKQNSKLRKHSTNSVLALVWRSAIFLYFASTNFCNWHSEAKQNSRAGLTVTSW